MSCYGDWKVAIGAMGFGWEDLMVLIAEWRNSCELASTELKAIFFLSKYF